jgi:hypothetical protein
MMPSLLYGAPSGVHAGPSINTWMWPQLLEAFAQLASPGATIVKLWTVKPMGTVSSGGVKGTVALAAGLVIEMDGRAPASLPELLLPPPLLLPLLPPPLLLPLELPPPPPLSLLLQAKTATAEARTTAT